MMLACAEFLVPCCILTISPLVYTVAFKNPNDQYNYTNVYVIWPINVLTSTIIVICYLSICISVRKSNKKLSKNMSYTSKDRRVSQELRFAAQFSVISFFY